MMKQIFIIALIGSSIVLFQNCSSSKLVLPGGGPAVTADQIEMAILSQPSDQSVIANSEASFQVRVSDAEGVTYQWFFGDQAIPGQTTDTLTLSQVKLTDIGQYYVVVYRDGEPVLTSQPGSLSVESPVLGNLTMAVGIGTNNINNGAVLAVCPAGTQKVSNVSVQNVPGVDNNEGAPGFIDFALCEQNGILSNMVALSTDQCAAFGGNVVAQVTYKNVSTQDEGRETLDNVVLSLCDSSGAIDSASVRLATDGCLAGQTSLSEFSFRNLGTLEGANPGAPANVSISFCSQ